MNIIPTSVSSYTKIITHAGAFHADELLAIALLRVLGNDAPIERNNVPTEDAFADASIVVLDVGKRYEPGMANFDHHQDGTLEATNLLLLRHVSQALEPGLAESLASRLFERVSDIDRGRVVLSDALPAPEFNMLIRAFNTLPDGFERALGVAIEILSAQVATARKALADQDRWQALEKRDGIAVQHDTDPILGWKEQAKAEGISLMVCPNQRGGYSIISRDTEEFRIPEHPAQRFLHASGFMATYETFTAALTHAETLVPFSKAYSVVSTPQENGPSCN